MSFIMRDNSVILLGRIAEFKIHNSKYDTFDGFLSIKIDNITFFIDEEDTENLKETLKEEKND